MTKIRKEIINFPLGEVTQEEMMVADFLARGLLESGDPSCEVKLRDPEGQEVSGLAFSFDGGWIIVTDGFIALSETGKKIDQYLPR